MHRQLGRAGLPVSALFRRDYRLDRNRCHVVDGVRAARNTDGAVHLNSAGRRQFALLVVFPRRCGAGAQMGRVI